VRSGSNSLASDPMRIAQMPTALRATSTVPKLLVPVVKEISPDGASCRLVMRAKST
jgi:hypothetical protein